MIKSLVSLLKKKKSYFGKLMDLACKICTKGMRGFWTLKILREGLKPQLHVQILLLADC